MGNYETEHTKYVYKALATTVLVCAVINKHVKDFSVYIRGVKGYDHSEEFMEVAEYGTKLQRSIAEILFYYEFRDYRWRD